MRPNSASTAGFGQRVEARWPTSAYLLPLDGPPIEVDVRRGLCERTVEEALRMRGRFNDRPSRIASTDPIAVSMSVLPAPSRVFRVWPPRQAGLGADRLLLVIAEVLSAEASQGGGYSLLLRLQGGSVEGPSASLVRVNPSEHPAVLWAVAGSRLAATGLYRVDGRERLLPQGQRPSSSLSLSGQAGSCEVGTWSVPVSRPQPLVRLARPLVSG